MISTRMNVRRMHFINFVRKFAVATLFFLAPLHFLALGFGALAIGAIMSCFAAAPILFAFPTGWINDRFSIKRVILVALLAQSILFVAIGHVSHAAGMAVLFLLTGLANSALDVSINSLYYKDPSEGNPNRKYGLYILWLSLGPAAGILFGGMLLFSSGFPLLVTVFGAITALSAFSLRRIDGEKFSMVEIREYRAEIFNKKVLAFSLFLLILALHWGVEGTVYSPFLRAGLGLNDFQVALYISMAYLSLAGASLLVCRLKFDARRNRGLFLLGMMLSGVGLALMARHDVRLSFFFRLVHEAGDGLLAVLSIVYISNLFEKRTIGGSAGILSALQTAGQMTGAMAFSWLGYRSGLEYPFFIAGALLIANAALGVFALPTEAARQESPPAPLARRTHEY
jgi:MFS family permease